MCSEDRSNLSGGNDYFLYVSARCSLGFVLTAVSPDGICAILFGNTREELDRAIRSEFPDRDPTYGGYGLEGIGAQTVNAVETPRAHVSMPLHLVATTAEVRVWQVLQSVPAGDIITSRTDRAATARHIPLRQTVSLVSQTGSLSLFPAIVP